MINRKIISIILSITILSFTLPGNLPAKEVSAPSLDKKISLDIKGMDILDVLKIISTQSGLNIVAGRNVTGRVTIYLKDVDVWDAFEIILASNDLAYEQKGNIINVMTDRDYELKHGEKFHAKKDIKAVTLRYTKAAEIAKALTQVKTPLGKVITDEASNTIIVIDVPENTVLLEDMIYQLDVPTVTESYTFKYATVADIKDNFTDMLTPNLGVLKVDERSNKIVVEDVPQVVDEIIRMALAFDDKTPQVFIECEIIEISLEDEFELGVDWTVVLEGIGGTTQGGIVSTLYNAAAIASPASPALTIGKIFGSGSSIDAVVRALSKFGKTRSLSNPRLTVLNNQEAKVMVGTREPYATTSQSQAGTGTTITADTINFIDTGTNLFIKPTINPDGMISMNIKPEISAKFGADFESPGGSKVPVVRTTEAETTMIVKDGETIILGGLIEDKLTENENKIPLFGDIPWVGQIFRYNYKKVEKTELVIFITPHLLAFDGTKMKIKEPEEAKQKDSNGMSKNAYLQILSEGIANKIREMANFNAEGSIRLIFNLNRQGELIGEPRAIGAKYKNIKDVAIAAVKIASPFPPFPLGMSKEEEKFNILISFE